MNMLMLTSNAEELNPLTILPDLSKIAENLPVILRLAVMVGPFCLLGLGLWYLLAPTREANHSVGFRCWWGMSSVEVWQFTQRLAGLIWSGLGLVLTVVMAVLCSGYRKMEPDEMAFSALRAMKWELVLVLASIVVINGILIWQFNAKGYRRTGSRTH